MERASPRRDGREQRQRQRQGRAHCPAGQIELCFDAKALPNAGTARLKLAPEVSVPVDKQHDGHADRLRRDGRWS
jgi:hypothetical protein